MVSRRSGTGVAVFVKTPGLSPLKTRLAQSIGQENAQEFHLRSSQVIEDLLLRWKQEKKHEQGRDDLHLYWAVAEAQGLAHPLWKKLSRLSQGSGGLGERMSWVFDQLWKDHERIIFIGADSPQIRLSQLESLLNVGESAEFTLGLTEDGGFCVLVAQAYIPFSLWTSVEYSQARTAKEFTLKLDQLGRVNCSPKKFYDVDVVEDLERLGLEDTTQADWTKAQREIILWARAMTSSQFVD